MSRDFTFVPSERSSMTSIDVALAPRAKRARWARSRAAFSPQTYVRRTPSNMCSMTSVDVALETGGDGSPL
jgi:hypothetical protein